MLYYGDDVVPRTHRVINVGFAVIPVLSLEEIARKTHIQKEITHVRQVTVTYPNPQFFTDIPSIGNNQSYRKVVEKLYPVNMSEEFSMVLGLLKLFNYCGNVYSCSGEITLRDYQKAGEQLMHDNCYEPDSVWTGNEMSVLFSVSKRDIMFFAACDMNEKITHMSKAILLRPKSMIVLKPNKNKELK
jgi:hypothetical protein